MTTSQLSSLLLLLLTFGVCTEVMGQRNPFDIKRMRGSEDVMVGPFSGTYVIGAEQHIVLVIVALSYLCGVYRQIGEAANAVVFTVEAQVFGQASQLGAHN